MQNHLQKRTLDYVTEGSKIFFFQPAANLPIQPPVWHSNAETPLELSKDLEVVDLGPVSMFLAIRIHCDRAHRRIFLSQKSFITDLLDTWKMTNCHPSPVPLRQKLQKLLTPPPNSLPDFRDDDIKLNFQHLVGSLIYLAVCTQPDIAYVAMALGQYNASPTRAHPSLLAAKGVLHYLAGTSELSLVFGMDNLMY